MAGSGLPCTVVICCSLPAGIGREDAAARLDAGRHADVPVTWLAALDWLPRVVDRLGGDRHGGSVALDIPARCPRTAARELLSRARQEAPALDAVAVRGPLDAPCRQELAAGGVRVVYREGADTTARGSRRPAPSGWACHSPVWGMWEVAASDDTCPPAGIRLIFGATGGVSVRPGGLAVVDVGHGVTAGQATSVIRSRLGRWKAWAAGRWRSPKAVFRVLSQVPDLITTASRGPVGGSILRAA
jgi:hypothetical protein